jgi:hypothetical protein
MSGAYVAPGSSTGLSYGFCESEPGSTATVGSVPAAVPKGAKYTSGAGDWSAGKGKGTNGSDAGFFCLKFSVDQPQYYQYGYSITGPGTTAGDTVNIVALGDLDGNGTTSLFAMQGQIATQSGATSLVWAPKVAETNPEE